LEPRVVMSITYEAVLDVSDRSVQFLSGLLDEERVRRGIRKDTRATRAHPRSSRSRSRSPRAAR
jgi:hypothetical protein